MANEKLTWLELRKAVAEYANTSEQEAGQFLSALLDGIVEGLKADRQVKVKGLGSFSLKAVAPRKSVNIATGESFTIDGYNKLAFSAESMLKESVEKRIEQPKTDGLMEDINPDPLRKLGEQANEIVDILAELGQTVNTNTSKNTKENKVDKQKEVEEVEAVEKIEDVPAVESTPEPIVAEEPLTTEIIEDSNEVEDVIENEEKTIVSETIDNQAGKTSAKKTKCHCRKWICWAILLILLLGAIGAGVYFQHTIKTWWHCVKQCTEVALNNEEEKITQSTIIPSETNLNGTDKANSNVNESEETSENGTIAKVNSDQKVLPLADQPREYVNFIGIERIGKNSRLAWIAFKYYAQKDLWVFIYEANRDIIKDPNHVQSGQHIRIPELDEKYRNLYNPELRQLVDSLSIEYLRK